MNKGGGSAFPVLDSESFGECNEYSRTVCTSEGMTLRDYFAGQALAGMLASTHDYSLQNGVPVKKVEKLVSKMCYTLADAMIGEKSRNNRR